MVVMMRQSKTLDNAYFNNYSGDPKTSLVSSLELLKEKGYETKKYDLRGPNLYYTIRNHDNTKVQLQFAVELGIYHS